MKNPRRLAGGCSGMEKGEGLHRLLSDQVTEDPHYRRRAAKRDSSHHEQPWQRPFEQPEQLALEEAELTKRSPALQPNTENFFLTWIEPQEGHSTEALLLLTNFSKSAPQTWQLNSKIGNPSHLLPKSIRTASGGPSPSPPETSESLCPSGDVLQAVR